MRTLKKEDFPSIDLWRQSVRDSANSEFCKTSEGVCPISLHLKEGEYGCDCPKTRVDMGLTPCTEKTAFCPVRNAGWPEHTPYQLARFSKALSGG